MAERNNFLWRMSQNCVLTRAHTQVSLNSSSLGGSTFEKCHRKASLVFVDPNMMCISDHVSKVSIEAVMLGFSGVL